MNFLRCLLLLVLTILIVAVAEEKSHSSFEVVRCPFPTQQIHSHEARKCVSLVNGPCSINKSDKLTDCSNKTSESENATEDALLLGHHHDHSIECISGAFCNQVGLFGYCTCKAGLVETADRKCALMYGQSCNISSEVKCDKDTLLGCIEGKCDCENPMHQYEEPFGLCLGKVGAFCKNLSLEQQRKFVPNHDYVICGYGANCFNSAGVRFVDPYTKYVGLIEFADDRFGNGVCRCDEMFGFRETENRTCEYTRRIYEEDDYICAEIAISDLVLIIVVILMVVIICFIFTIK